VLRNKTICLKHFKQAKFRGKYELEDFNKLWDEGKGICFKGIALTVGPKQKRKYSNIELSWVTGNIEVPEKCPFVLEHLMEA